MHAGYGRTTVLRDVSLEVPAGAVTALLGPNGAGKTTLLRAVSGFLPVTADGLAVRRRRHDDCGPSAVRAGLCHVPEGRGIFRSLDRPREPRDAVEARATRPQAIERATSAFPILGERLGQHAGTLSGGQQQMLAMAAAYVRDPRLILVDEASLGLAPLVVDEIFAFLQQVTTEGASLLIVDQFAHRALGDGFDGVRAEPRRDHVRRHGQGPARRRCLQSLRRRRLKCAGDRRTSVGRKGGPRHRRWPGNWSSTCADARTARSDSRGQRPGYAT